MDSPKRQKTSILRTSSGAIDNVQYFEQAECVGKIKHGIEKRVDYTRDTSLNTTRQWLHGKLHGVEISEFTVNDIVVMRAERTYRKGKLHGIEVVREYVYKKDQKFCIIRQTTYKKGKVRAQSSRTVVL
jgi:hypothetical protein